KLAADQGHAGAQTNLGAMYAKGQGVVQNYKEASKWFKLAAEQGFALSKCFLAEMYINGHGIKRNPSMAKKMAKEGYEAGADYCKDVWEKYNLTNY
ncbi:MAG TPA: hypothetical protein PLT97_10545, partial [Smithellaceae bacterium]|nr:hypothetical protein [Smithellaceae bacterium]HQK28424.1 hypothetical protein [Smithellaceae bacterium]